MEGKDNAECSGCKKETLQEGSTHIKHRDSAEQKQTVGSSQFFSSSILGRLWNPSQVNIHGVHEEATPGGGDDSQGPWFHSSLQYKGS